jgi:hypothetical protein
VTVLELYVIGFLGWCTILTRSGRNRYNDLDVDSVFEVEDAFDVGGGWNSARGADQIRSLRVEGAD